MSEVTFGFCMPFFLSGCYDWNKRSYTILIVRSGQMANGIIMMFFFCWHFAGDVRDSGLSRCLTDEICKEGHFVFYEEFRSRHIGLGCRFLARVCISQLLLFLRHCFTTIHTRCTSCRLANMKIIKLVVIFTSSAKISYRRPWIRQRKVWMAVVVEPSWCGHRARRPPRNMRGSAYTSRNLMHTWERPTADDRQTVCTYGW